MVFSLPQGTSGTEGTEGTRPAHAAARQDSSHLKALAAPTNCNGKTAHRTSEEVA